jgi:hypothetical protein
LLREDAHSLIMINELHFEHQVVIDQAHAQNDQFANRHLSL